jgi:hypothetical protein
VRGSCGPLIEKELADIDRDSGERHRGLVVWWEGATEGRGDGDILILRGGFICQRTRSWNFRSPEKLNLVKSSEISVSTCARGRG